MAAAAAPDAARHSEVEGASSFLRHRLKRGPPRPPRTEVMAMSRDLTCGYMEAVTRLSAAGHGAAVGRGVAGCQGTTPAETGWELVAAASEAALLSSSDEGVEGKCPQRQRISQGRVSRISCESVEQKAGSKLRETPDRANDRRTRCCLFPGGKGGAWRRRSQRIQPACHAVRAPGHVVMQSHDRLRTVLAGWTTSGDSGIIDVYPSAIMT